MPPDEEPYPTPPPPASPEGKEPPPDWQLAWHGTKVQCTYSIIIWRRILESHNASLGHQYGYSPAVYLHNDKNKTSAESYVTWVSVNRDGHFYATKIEVEAGRAKRIAPTSKAPQWLQRSEDVTIRATWIGARTKEDLVPSTWVEPGWRPEDEANPWDPRVAPFRAPPPAAAQPGPAAAPNPAIAMLCGAR